MLGFGGSRRRGRPERSEKRININEARHQGDHLKAARQKSGISRQDMASKMGYSMTTLRQLEQGEQLTESAIRAYAKALNIDPDVLRDAGKLKAFLETADTTEDESTEEGPSFCADPNCTELAEPGRPFCAEH